jgi:hypothetical protein
MFKLRSSSRLVGSLLLVLGLGCGEPAAPTPQPSPPTPTATSGYIWGHVLDQSGLCLPGAEVEVVDGPGVGRKSSQPGGCAAWDYVGYEFRDLQLGTTVTLRATTPGYQPQDRELVVQNGGSPVQFVLATE